MVDRDEEHQLEQPTVVVIDDSVEVHRLLNARLRSEPITLRFASNGEDGFKAIESDNPAVILLDLNMPGMDGFEVLRRLKAESRTANIPVIVISGLDGPDDKVTAFGLGAQDYVTKPLDFVELRIRLHVALRVHNLVSMLEQRAQVDGLTGLWNRAYFDTRWTEATSIVDRHSRPVSLALFDLDKFKSINDTFGHPAGDAVLEIFAQIIKSEARVSDVACRYGGEEIALIMPDTEPSAASSVCERIRGRLERTVFPKHPERRVTVSTGVAGATAATSLTPAQWLEQADTNLYRAKKEGRNRVVSTDVSITHGDLAQAG